MNGGDSYLTTEVDFDPGSLLFHPTIVEVVLAYDEEHGDLYVSSDFGANWNRISEFILTFSHLCSLHSILPRHDGTPVRVGPSGYKTYGLLRDRGR